MSEKKLIIIADNEKILEDIKDNIICCHCPFESDFHCEFREESDCNDCINKYVEFRVLGDETALSTEELTERISSLKEETDRLVSELHKRYKKVEVTE